MDEHEKSIIVNNNKLDLSKYKIMKEEIGYEEDTNGDKKEVKLIYIQKNTKYYDNIKKAVDKYTENNREKVNKLKNDRHKERYQNDPEYRERVKKTRREAYHKNKNKDKESEKL